MTKKRNKKIDPIRDIIGFVAQDSLDYHEFEQLDPYMINKLLSEFLEDSYIKRLTQVLVVTGKGNVVRPLVQKYLGENIYVESFKTAGYFNGQTGAFEVYLKQSL